MKAYITILVFVGLLLGCSEEQQLVEAKEENASVAFEPNRTYPNTEYCVIKHSLNGTAGAIGTIPEESISIAEKNSFTNSTNGEQYGIHLSFLGSKKMKDYYSIQIEVKGEIRPPLERVYIGQELVLFRDPDYVILLRPRMNSEPVAGQPDNPPVKL